MVAMIPIRKLLEDQTFAKFFYTTPAMYPHQAARKDGWRLWVKLGPDSPWRRKDVEHYQSGVRFVRRGVEAGDLQDAVLQCRGVSYQPPVRRFIVKDPKTRKPVVEVVNGVAKRKIVERVWAPSSDLIQEYGPHEWCFYCRRPVIFGYFSKHPAFKGTSLEPYYDGNVRRCCVCGISHESGRR
jgi:hypothetical protein